MGNALFFNIYLQWNNFWGYGFSLPALKKSTIYAYRDLLSSSFHMCRRSVVAVFFHSQYRIDIDYVQQQHQQQKKKQQWTKIWVQWFCLIRCRSINFFFFKHVEATIFVVFCTFSMYLQLLDFLFRWPLLPFSW